MANPHEGPLVGSVVAGFRQNTQGDDSSHRTPRRTSTDTVNASSPARILLIEDEAKTARAVLNGLKAEGFAPVWAETGEDGFFLLSSQHFDAVVLDWMLPGSEHFYAEQQQILLSKKNPLIGT